MTRSPRIPVLAGVVLTLAALALGVHFLTDGGADVAGAEPDGAAAARTTARPDQPDPPPEPDGRRQRTEVTDADAYAAELDAARWIDGRVVFPTGTPADESVEVIALGAPFEHGPPHGTPVAEDGAFRVAVPRETSEVRFYMRARYLYLEETPYPIDWRNPRVPGRDMEGLPDVVVLEPELGGRFEGRLLLPENTPMDIAPGAAEIHVVGEPNSGLPPFARAAVMDGSTFAIDAVPAEASCDLWCELDQFVIFRLDALVATAGRTQQLTLRPTLGARIAGRIVRPDGIPVPDVWLEADAERQVGSFTRSKGRTADDGTFDLSAIRPGDVRLTIHAPGMPAITHGPLRLAPGDVVTDLEIVVGTGPSISGIVRWPDGRPVPKAAVRASPVPEPPSSADSGRNLRGLGYAAAVDDGAGETIAGPTDERGRFRLTGLREGRHDVRAIAWIDESGEPGPSPSPGFENTCSRWTALLEGVATGEDVELVLGAGLTVSGTVVDETGSPVHDYRITAMPGGGSAPDPRASVWRDFHSPDGAFSLSGLEREGRWEVVASSGNVRASAPVLVEVPQRRRPLRLVMPRPAAVGGVVVDAAGTPLKDAFVTLWRKEPPLVPFARDCKIAVDANGRFLFPDVGPGAVHVYATEDWHAGTGYAALRAESGQRHDLRFELTNGCRLTGQAYTAGGAPAARYEVRVRGGAGHSATDTKTDSEGRFALTQLLPGLYRVSVRTPRAEPSESDDREVEIWSGDQTVTLAEGEGAHVVLVARDEPVTVRGRVLVGGRHVAGAFVTALSAHHDLVSEQAQTGAGGDYELELARPGPYAFRVRTPAGATTWQAVSVEESPFELDFDLDLATIRGVVHGPDGAPAARTDVFLHGESYWMANTMTDAEGAYAFAVEPGTWAVSAGGRFWGSRGGNYGMVVRPGLMVEEGAVLDGIDLDLQRAGRVSGRVVNAAGAPVPEARVYARLESGALTPANPAISGRNGRFLIDGLAAGSVTLSAIGSDSASNESEPVVVRPGGTSNVGLTLSPATCLTVVALDADGYRVSASIKVFDDGGRDCTLGDDFDGGLLRSESYVLIGPLPRGAYTVRATLPSGATAERRIVSGDELEELVEFRFDDRH